MYEKSAPGHSAIRKCVRVQLIKNGKKIVAFVPDKGCLNLIDEKDGVLVAGFGRNGHAVGDTYSRDRCYFKKYFCQKIGEKIGVFDSKRS
jgi:hypothetical protein